MDKEIAPIALKQRYNTLLQKLNSAVVDTNTGKRKDDLFVERVVNLIENGEKFRSRLSVEKIAIEEFGFSDKQFVKELTEYAIIVVARMIAKKYPLEEAYRNLVLLYENQPYSTHQTNVSISLNQYSTPVPISYLLGKYIGLTYDSETKTKILEPTAGNGMLTVAGNPKNIVVNEIDHDRLHILKKQGFKQILSQDATMPFPFEREFDGVLANPPFGGSSTLVIGGYNISGLDQQIIVKSLEYLKDNSKAAFIFGGHTAYDDKGRVKGAKDKAFLNYIARFYFIDDLINLNGRLYSKQGTSYPIRLLFIRSRKSNPEGFFPLKNNDLSNLQPFSPHVVMSFIELFDRTQNFF